MLPNVGMGELVLILLIVLLVFGFWADVEQLLDPFHEVSFCWAEEAVITHLSESMRQCVLEEASDEFLGFKRFRFVPTRAGIAITKCDLAILELDYVVVGNADPENIRCEVFHCCSA